MNFGAQLDRIRRSVVQAQAAPVIQRPSKAVAVVTSERRRKLWYQQRREQRRRDGLCMPCGRENDNPTSTSCRFCTKKQLEYYHRRGADVRRARQAA